MKRDCYIVADVGGTYVRFAAVEANSESISCRLVLRCTDFEQFDLALHYYLKEVFVPTKGLPKAACFAVAGAVLNDPIKLTNSPWCIDRTNLANQLRCPVSILNDFAAQACYLPALNEEDLSWLRKPQNSSHKDQLKLLVGPGTGLGSAACLPSGEVVAMESGNIRFNPANEVQQEIVNRLSKRGHYISAEQVVSGPGIATIYSTLTSMAGQPKEKTAAEISAGAQAGDPLCLETLAEFSIALGAVCGDIAITLASWGGVYLSGGVLTKLGNLFSPKLFLEAFSHRGCFSTHCSAIPISRILSEELGLLGAAHYLRSQGLHQTAKSHVNRIRASMEVPDGNTLISKRINDNV